MNGVSITDSSIDNSELKTAQDVASGTSLKVSISNVNLSSLGTLFFEPNTTSKPICKGNVDVPTILKSSSRRDLGR